MIRYLILHEGKAFYTHWFGDNFWVKGMIVFDLKNQIWTNDNVYWSAIVEDYL